MEICTKHEQRWWNENDSWHFGARGRWISRDSRGHIRIRHVSDGLNQQLHSEWDELLGKCVADPEVGHKKANLQTRAIKSDASLSFLPSLCLKFAHGSINIPPAPMIDIVDIYKSHHSAECEECRVTNPRRCTPPSAALPAQACRKLNVTLIMS